MWEIARETDQDNHRHQVSFFSDTALEIVIFSTKIRQFLTTPSDFKVFWQSFARLLIIISCKFYSNHLRFSYCIIKRADLQFFRTHCGFQIFCIRMQDHISRNTTWVSENSIHFRYRGSCRRVTGWVPAIRCTAIPPPEIAPLEKTPEVTHCGSVRVSTLPRESDSVRSTG